MLVRETDRQGAENGEEIRSVLQRFQEGYCRRDVPGAAEFAGELFVSGRDVVIIGTGAAQRGGYEWCEGPEEACGIIAEDWRSWGDLILDMERAHIDRHDEVAWVATVGIVCRHSAGRGEAVQAGLQPTPVHDLPPQLQRLASSAGLTGGNRQQLVWPVRWSAVLIRSDAGWAFSQMHFSYPGLIDS